jgi:dTDP-4-amino-4,6-dideoxygalactose transaminase
VRRLELDLIRVCDAVTVPLRFVPAFRAIGGYNPNMRPTALQALEAEARIPFVDLGPANAAVKARILDRIAQTIDTGDFVNGAAVEQFELAFADRTGRNHCVGLSSGLDALRLSLEATGLERGAGVVVPAATFAATFEAVLQADGLPVVVDVNDDDYTLDAQQTQDAAASASHLVPVHLYGQMADMRALADVAGTQDVTIVEDACQAHGASRDGIAPGGRARAAVFSFYPSKNLGAMGDAGALVTDDGDLATLVRALRSHGETDKYHHEYIGYTARLDTLQAIVLLEKLPLLEKWNEERQAAAAYYTEALAGLDGLRLPRQAEGSEPVWHLFVVRVSEPKRFAAFLASRGIETGRHYPHPPHLSPAYRDLGFGPGDFPVAEAIAREGVSLPLYPGIGDAQLERICNAVAAYLREL